MTAEESRSEGGRHRAREVALQVLYAIDLGRARRASVTEAGLEGEGPGVSRLATAAGDSDAIFDRIVEHFVVPTSSRDFARRLVAAVVANATAIDELLGTHARNWRVSRMAAVDRNVLRLAVWELRDTDTPVAVVIDEAVDLARRFGSDTSPAFVNGILDAVAREVRAA